MGIAEKDTNCSHFAFVYYFFKNSQEYTSFDRLNRKTYQAYYFGTKFH